MGRGDCSCRAKGRLFIHVESEMEEIVKVSLTEEHGYCDIFHIYMKEGHGELRVDGIAYGSLRIETNIDHEQVYYYPSHVILFQKNQYIHKVNVIDRRKKSAL